MDYNTQVESIPSFMLDLKSDTLAISTLAMRVDTYLDKIGKTLDHSLRDANSSEIATVLSYKWSHEAKEVALLLRDCMLNLLRLKYLEKDSLRSKEDVANYKRQVSSRVHEATKALDQSYQKILSGAISVDAKWIHETNPITVITEHLKTIGDQIKKINRSQHKLDNIASSFEDYTKSYIDKMQIRVQRSMELKEILSNITEGIRAIPTPTDSIALGKLINLIDSQVEAIENQSNMSSYESIALEDIDKLTLPVSSQGGRLQNKQIDILSEVSTWTSFNLSGPLRDIDRKFLNHKEKTIISLLQLSNRLKAKMKLAEGEALTIVPEEMNKPVQRLIDDHDNIIIPEVHKKIKELQDELKRLLKVNNLFDDKKLFLPVSKLNQLSSSLTYKDTIQKRYNPDNIISKFHKWTNGIFSREKIKEKPTSAAYIDWALDFDAGHDQNALFMRKGFLGSSFQIQRPILQLAMTHHFEHWQSGFGGALLITGNHGSGKSNLLELLPHLHPDIESHHLVQSQSLDINGHKIIIGHDLIKSLNEIVKHLDVKPSIITIDNIEQYVSDAQEMYDLFNALQAIIRKYGQKTYIAITLEERQRARLGIFFDLENVFSETIRTDDMAISLIEDAILMRAMAVSDHDEVTQNSDKLRQKAKMIAQQSRGNIGLAMQLWCSHSSDPNKKISSEGFVNKINNHQSLLRYMLCFEQINMGSLQIIFDDVEFKKISADIEHLCQQKILIRRKAGNFSVHPYLRTQIHQILSQSKLN